MEHIEIIEDAVQAALMAGLTSWLADGIPDDPEAWLYRVGRNEAIGTLRKDARRQRLLGPVKHELLSTGADHAESPDQELLRMVFVCCDEAMPMDSRLVLALKTLCGFSTGEIAARLFTTEGNVLKRLGRARDRLREIAPPVDALPTSALSGRLPSVRLVLYLIFNEGYLSGRSDRAVRRELCDEAIRLTTLLAEDAVGAQPETFALLALMHFHRARLNARIDAAGTMLVLEDQDCTLWDGEHVQLGAAWLAKASSGEAFTRFHAEAGIAAEHIFALTFAETRWREIADLYAILDRVAPSPLNSLNRAVAIAEWRGADAGLAALEGVERPPWLAEYHLWDAVLGDLHRRAGHTVEARRYLERALSAAPTDAERELLGRRIASLGDAGAEQSTSGAAIMSPAV